MTLSKGEIRAVIRLFPNDPLGMLRDIGGYYECPKNSLGKRLGPLVGYAGTYALGMHYVGDVYANWAKAEEYPLVLDRLACGLAERVSDTMDVEGIDVVCGAPMGGLSIGLSLARELGCRFVYAEKKVTRAASGGEREEAKLVLGRHEIQLGDDVVIAEDVLNNFRTTVELCKLVREAGGRILGIAGLLNRSLTVCGDYVLPDGIELPVIALVRKPIPEWQQDDPAVVADVHEGNVVWKPKAEWPRLMAAMEAARVSPHAHY